MRIPAADLRAQHASLRDELLDAVGRVLDNAAFINGVEVEAFEREFAAYCEVAHVVGVANGTDALGLALRALGVGPGDAVAVPAFTFAATAEAVYHVGAAPLLVDIDPQTFTLDPLQLRKTIRGAAAPVRAIIPVHLFGQVAAMEDIAAVAGEGDAAIVEDAAQAHGARDHGRRVGGLGRLACFSFYPTKNLGALGDAGAVSSNDAGLTARLQRLRDHGQQGKYLHSEIGFNSRLDAVQAAALRVKLPHLDAWNARRQVLAQRYCEGLHGIPGVAVPGPVPGREHVYHLFVIRCRDRDGLRRHLEAHDIATSVHYPLALHQQAAFRDLGYRLGDLPCAEAAAREVLALPLYPELGEAAVDAVCEAVHGWARG